MTIIKPQSNFGARLSVLANYINILYLKTGGVGTNKLNKPNTILAQVRNELKTEL